MIDAPVLRTPARDAPGEPVVSIVVPALDEEATIGEFVRWCHEGLRAARAAGEVLIVDSSSDRTAEIALAEGARVVQTPRRGLGRAYIDAISFIRGRYVIMGDCDCTYDFRVLAPFLDALHEGAEFVLGSRFAGGIEPDAMPLLHRRFGIPVTTWLLNTIHGSDFADIHCGMRALTRDALVRMRLSSQGWEYASEMVVKAVTLGLRRAQVPVRYLKAPAGRQSHHARRGWLSPWLAGVANVRVMLERRGGS